MHYESINVITSSSATPVYSTGRTAFSALSCSMVSSSLLYSDSFVLIASSPENEGSGFNVFFILISTPICYDTYEQLLQGRPIRPSRGRF